MDLLIKQVDNLEINIGTKININKKSNDYNIELQIIKE